LLAHHGIAFTPRDIFRAPLTEDEVRGLLGRSSVDDLFSWRSPTARARGLQPGDLDEDDAIRLMAGEPRLLRRPLILAGDRLIVGADERAIAALA